jgi:hypothetical protein
MGGKRLVNFRLTPECVRILEKLAKRLGMSRTSIVELSIRLSSKFWQQEFMNVAQDLSTLNRVKAFHAALGTAIKANPAGLASFVTLHTQLGNMLGSSDPTTINWAQLWAELLAILEAVLPIISQPPTPAPAGA